VYANGLLKGFPHEMGAPTHLRFVRVDNITGSFQSEGFNATFYSVASGCGKRHTYTIHKTIEVCLIAPNADRGL
jgi:hypothetical protein